MWQGSLVIKLVHLSSLPIMDSKSTDPYVKFYLPDKTNLKSSVAKQKLNHVFNEEFQKELGISTFQNSQLLVEVFDDDFGLDDLVGFV